MMIDNKYDFKLGIGFSLLCLIVLIYLIPDQVGPLTEPEALMPLLVTVFILILSLILTIQSMNFKGKLKAKSDKKHSLPTQALLFVMAIMIAYAWLLDYTGFLLTSVVGMYVLFSAFKVRKFKQTSVIIGVTLGILYVTFEKLLYAPLPVGTLIENLFD
jgi:hypothetical protein